MKIVKYILFGLGGIILLLVIVSFFLSSKSHVERSMTINAPVDVVFGQVNNLKSWLKWDPWMAMDPAIVSTYEGPESGIGAIHKWESKVVGSGAMTVTGVVPNESVDIKLDFKDHGSATGGFKFKSEGTATTATWTLDMDAGMNPIARIMGTMMDKMIGPDFEKGLTSLKGLCESMPKIEPVPAVQDSTAKQ